MKGILASLRVPEKLINVKIQFHFCLAVIYPSVASNIVVNPIQKRKMSHIRRDRSARGDGAGAGGAGGRDPSEMNTSGGAAANERSAAGAGAAPDTRK